MAWSNPLPELLFAVVPPDVPASPSDPEWVDEIVRRALERAGADESLATPSQPPTRPADAKPRQASAPPAQAPREARPAPTPVERRPSPIAHQAAPPAQPVAPAEPVAPAQPSAPVQAAPPAPRPPSDPSPAPAPPSDPAPAPPERRPPTVDELFADRARPAQTQPAERVSAYPDGDGLGAPRATDADERVFAKIAGTSGPYPDLDDDPMFNMAIGLDQDGADLEGSSRMRGFLEWGAVIVGALAVALVIKTFLMQAYFIPSSSMVPTLEIGDRVLVNKLSYDFGDIGRGDLIVFHRPPAQAEGEDDLIKRVIALGGEVIEMRDGEVFITTTDSTQQQRLEEPYLADDIRTSGLVNTDNCVNPTPSSCEIPEGHVFVLGDNRAGSRDSRWFGPISEDLVVGRAFLRVWPVGDVGFL